MKAELLSTIYRKGREHVIAHVYKKQHEQGKQRDLETVVEIGDKILRLLPEFAYTFPIPKGIGTKIHDLSFPSPLTLAAFKDDLDIINIWMQLGLGGACTKTIMEEKRNGNARPRLQEVSCDGYDGLLNAMGLPGPGIDEKINEIFSSRIFDHDRPVCLSIGGTSLDEYKRNFMRLEQFAPSSFWHPVYFEFNISCPNTPEGQQLSKHSDLLMELLRFARKSTSAVIGVKLSPDMSFDHIHHYVDLIEDIPKTYVNAGNTTFRRCVDVGLHGNAISTGGGGYSGPALYPRTLAMLQLIRENSNIPVISTGGIDSADKVQELLDNGASAVGMATAVVKDMYIIPKINNALER